MTTQTLRRQTATDNTVAAHTVSRNDKLTGITLSAFRVVVSFLFLCHGLMGVGAFGGIDGAGTAVEFGSWPGFYATVIEVVTAVLVGAGVFTRAAALLASGTMAYAYFVVHQELALLPLQNGGEPAALYSWIFLLIAVVGPGSLTVSALRRRRG
ncbi:DoxX family protein [Kibdelosporangium persicum]|uniref:Integral membrane protein n=1 Tax=Kibdelosporangium persicum TaxID=2698649 RepID=A0ABX2F818_9PSEU|nr:DoxX family protein [Kibdelosporangium persicum]NRN67467.1 Integral membrane protein [Kibdelosporangium persicum]